jgi:hypothetical protein
MRGRRRPQSLCHQKTSTNETAKVDQKMLDRSALREFRPLIATPAYGGSVATNYAMSMIQFSSACKELGISFSISFKTDSLITRCRNLFVAEFLGATSRFTHLFWIDADVGFIPDAAFRLFLADRDVVGGVYPLKDEFLPESGLQNAMSRSEFEAFRTRYPVGTGSEEAFELLIDSDGFMELAEVANGFLLIKRKVFLQLMEKYPELHCAPEHSISNTADKFYYRFFDPLVDPRSNRHLPEDYAFCHRWRNIGGKIFVDARSKLSHYGTQTYTGDFANGLRLQLNYAVGGRPGQKRKLTGLENL